MFCLALALGKTVRQLLAEIDSAELTEWVAYHGLDPFSLDRGDYQAAMIAAATVSPWAGKDKAPTPLDFMPDFGGLRKKQRQQKVDRERWASWAKAMQERRGDGD